MLVCYEFTVCSHFKYWRISFKFHALKAVGVILPCTSHKRLDDYTLYCHYTKIKAFE